MRPAISAFSRPEIGCTPECGRQAGRPAGSICVIVLQTRAFVFGPGHHFGVNLAVSMLRGNRLFRPDPISHHPMSHVESVSDGFRPCIAGQQSQ